MNEDSVRETRKEKAGKGRPALKKTGIHRAGKGAGRGHAAQVLAAVLLAGTLTSCQRGGAAETEPAVRDFFAMNTSVSFTAYGDGAEEALAAAEERMGQLESLWSVTEEGSEIYRVNHSGGEPVVLSRETADLAEFALEMAEETQGALEPTLYPVLEAWGFTTDEHRIPEETEIQELLSNTGYEKVRLDGETIRLPEGMELDLGAVGKGYAGDFICELLREQGITSALLDIGGNIQTIGTRPDGSDWRLGLRNPFGEGTVGVLTVSDCAVVTSGNYENYFVGEDGKTYGHILDPETGHPAESGLASVSIVTEEGKLGDALSTSLFVMGPEEAEAFWRENEDFEMIVITQDGEIIVTEGLEDRFVLGNDFQNMELQILER